MTTALDIIKRSLRMLGVYSIGDEPSADEAQDALTALNALMGSLSNTGMVYAETLDTIALTAGVSSITVGPSGTTITDRPIEVLAQSYILNGTVTYPLNIFTGQQYSDVAVKTTQGIPEAIWPLMNMPNAQLTFWPVPIGSLSLCLWSVKLLATFPTLTTTVTLPPGYEDALAPILAESMGPEYGTEPPPSVVRLAMRGRKNIEAMNFVAPMLQMPVGIGVAQFNILTGGSVRC